MTCGTLSPYEVRHYATNLSAFGPESVQRQLTAHVNEGFSLAHSGPPESLVGKWAQQLTVTA